MQKSKSEVEGQMSLFDMISKEKNGNETSKEENSGIEQSEPDLESPVHTDSEKIEMIPQASAEPGHFHPGDLVTSVYAPDREFVVLSEKNGMVIAQDPKTKDTHEMAAGDLSAIRHPGLIFDMDGTIWDSSENVAASWTEVLNRHPEVERQSVSRSDVQGVMGKTMTYIQKELGLSDSVMKECMTYENTYLSEHGGELYDGLEETLKKVSRIMPLYIVSNCQKGYIEAFFQSSGLGKYFQDHLCFGDNNKGKDKNIRILAKKNHLTDPIYIGDIEDDYIATVAAGAVFIHAAYGFGKVPEAEYRVNDIRELPEVLEKVKEDLMKAPAGGIDSGKA
ncbi:MAG: HAD hydrolase-like protein [Lachnospiraceae bacterium]|nr:HAD hydrolase-like protein [Lachnospiraceae bacterium]